MERGRSDISNLQVEMCMLENRSQIQILYLTLGFTILKLQATAYVLLTILF